MIFHVSGKRRLLTCLLAATLIIGGAAGIARAEPRTGPDLSTSDSTLLQQRTSRIAPGLELTSFQRLQTGGWVTGHVMTADLSTPTLALDVADGGEVSASNATVSEFAQESQAVAAVNSDYFDLNSSEAPIGTNISPTGGLRTAGSQPRQAFTLTDGKAAVQALMSAATVQLGDRTEEIGSVNSPTFAADSIGLFNQIWGSYPIARLLEADELVRVVTVVDGSVVSNTTDRTTITEPAAVPEGTSVLVARGTATSRLADAAVGSTVDVTVKASSDVELAIGGSQRLMTDGQPTTEDQVTAARTAIGVSKDGTKLHIVTIDGRQGDAHGMTLLELAQLMVDLGAWNALNLDGGGSTSLVARPAGTSEPAVINRPSDGHERADSNALVFRSTAPTDQIRGVALHPTLEPAAGLPDPAAYRLLPGLSRSLTATGLDGNLAATEVAGSLQISGQALQSHPTDGVVVGRSAGEGIVTYRAGEDSAIVKLRVYGRMTRLVPSATVISLPDGETSGSIALTAVDGDGNRVPVEARDASVEAEPGIEVNPGPVGTFTITPSLDQGASAVTFTVQGHQVTVPVTIGYEEQVIADFANAADWKAQTARATGSLAAASGPDGQPGLGLDFDFTQSTATRGMYAVPVTPIKIAGQPQSLSLWVNGTGQGEWPRLQVTKGDGTSTNLDGPNIDWTGWRQVRFPVPTGTPFPLTLTAIRFMEIRSTATYTDHLEVADLRARVPVAVELPTVPYVADPVIMNQGSVDGRPQRIAVMSDTQFVGRNPDSEIVQAGRRALREIVAADPELLVINGDFVDEAAMIDFELAKRVLDEEIGDSIPYVYVPGNHEIMGGPISNFESIFGDTTTVRELGDTRIITLDSSAGTLHPGGSTEQLQLLKNQLRDAATERDVTGVLIFHHHPIDDPHADQASQLTDRYEAAALQQLLINFQLESGGKPVAEINGHVGVFHADAVGGVSRVINGNSGKGPSGTADRGGFTGWSMIGVDPASASRNRLDWMRVETHARVDELTLTAPETLAIGAESPAAATILQDGDRVVPVAWPVTAQWGGEDVWIPTQKGERPDRQAVVGYDPATQTVRGLRRGTATLEVTVNGATERTRITVR